MEYIVKIEQLLDQLSSYGFAIPSLKLRKADDIRYNLTGFCFGEYMRFSPVSNFAF